MFMKKLSTIIVLLICLLVNAKAQKTYALLTGVSNYGDSSANLVGATKDVKSLQKVLKNQGAIITVSTSRYVTYDNIMKRLDAIIRLAKPEDAILFFFSGHGDTGCFVTYGLQSFPYSDLINKLAKAKSQHIFCFVDACRSGSIATAIGHNFQWSQLTGNKITFFMGCRADEYSYENQWLGHGFFTQALLKGLRGKADKNGDRKITVQELFNYIHSDVVARTRNSKVPQHPQLIGSRSNINFVLATW